MIDVIVVEMKTFDNVGFDQMLKAKEDLSLFTLVLDWLAYSLTVSKLCWPRTSNNVSNACPVNINPKPCADWLVSCLLQTLRIY